MTRFIIIVDVFRVFVDTGEIKYIPFSEEALQCLYVGRAYVDLQVVGTDNDFHIGIMLPANPLYFLQQIDLLFPEHLGGFPVFPVSIILHFLFGEFSFPVSQYLSPSSFIIFSLGFNTSLVTGFRVEP